jgi:Domain of unknown function (DUF4136)
MRRAMAVFLLVAAAASVVAARAKIEVQKDEKFDFGTLKAWTWNPSGPGNVRVWLTAESKSEPVKRTYEPVIMKAVEDELGRRGLTPASGGPADFTVTYYVLITASTNSQEMGQFLPAVTQFGVPAFAPATTSLKIFPQGTLVLDVGSPDKDHVVWRAVAQAEVDLDKTEAQRSARLQSLVRDMLAKLPRK